ncbi:MAG: GNAT family N-acetyltransferase [Alphaproteobacteria bacterium]|nr:GNAT family N-acetyltransferase [Alphaproteobacteria bacterium]MCA0449318.1 GNAT family N-acetyltransferase [Pseudomonadota bacterium]
MNPLDLRLETPRLVLRVPNDADAEALAAWLTEWEIARWTANIPHPYGIENARSWIADVRASIEAARALSFVIERRDAAGAIAPGVIGGVGVALDGPGKEGDLGWWIAIPHQGNGYAFEAAARLVEFCWSMEMTRLTAGALPDNAPSLAVARKLGMRPNGKLLRSQPARETPRETLEFVLER